MACDRPIGTRRRTPAKYDRPTPPYATGTAFDETNRLSDAGLAPLLALAERADLRDLLDERLTVAAGKGEGDDATAKITSVVAGMAAGADSIDDLDVLRRGATQEVFAGIKAPSTIGSHLRAYTFGRVRQLDAVSWRLLIGLLRCTGWPGALAKAGAVTHVDVDNTVKKMHGYAQQGVAFGYSPVKGLNALRDPVHPCCWGDGAGDRRGTAVQGQRRFRPRHTHDRR